MNIQNKKIIWCIKSDLCLSWVHNLTQNKILYEESDTYEIYYSNTYDVFFFYFKGEDNNYENIFNNISTLIKDFKNDVHVVLCDFRSIVKVVELLDRSNDIKFSLVNHVGEMIYDDKPIPVKYLKNIKYYFSCSDLFNEKNTICDLQNTNKFIKDYKYSFLYFYFKLGFNFIQRGDHIIENNNLKDGIFLYNKSKEGSQRYKLIEMVEGSEKLVTKEFYESDIFWFGVNNRIVHSSFLIDYNTCKFNLIMETQPLTKNENVLSRFITEKTLKSLLTPTPSYVVMQEDVYNELVEYGFYFLNNEFGDYNFLNYQTFCNFLKNTNDESFNKLHIKSIEKSKLNKIKLEEYIYSDKIKELKLLLNE
jgi:hypothetical protein